jgi:Zn-dependent peptidase ImmA (M78 family)
MNLHDQQANRFATAILMPMELVQQQYAEVSQIAQERHWGMEQIVTEMASRFQVSEARMALRIGEMQAREADRG